MADDILAHAPLPYLVVTRTVMTDAESCAPQRQTHEVIAYSLMEAMMQATTLVRGIASGLAQDVQVESCMPDLTKYYAMLRDATKAQGRR